MVFIFYCSFCLLRWIWSKRADEEKCSPKLQKCIAQYFTSPYIFIKWSEFSLDSFGYYRFAISFHVFPIQEQFCCGDDKNDAEEESKWWTQMVFFSVIFYGVNISGFFRRTLYIVAIVFRFMQISGRRVFSSYSLNLWHCTLPNVCVLTALMHFKNRKKRKDSYHTI